MGKGEMIEIQLENHRRSRAEFAAIQSEASIYADRLLWMAQRLKSLVRESAEGLSKLHEMDQVTDLETLKTLGGLPTREKLDLLLTGMITQAAAVESARIELEKLGVPVK